MHRDLAPSCALARADCPHRATCEHDAQRLARARAGSRADFDAVYDRAFALFYRASLAQLPSRELAQSLTRELLQSIFREPIEADACTAAHWLGLMKRVRAKWVAP